MKWICLTVCLISCTTSTALDVEHRLVRCAQILVKEAPNHELRADSIALTRAALQELQTFRTQNLRQFEFEPTNAPVNGHATSRPWTRANITGRISGILKQGEELVEIGEDPTRKQRLFGRVYEAEADIAQYLRARIALGQTVMRDSQNFSQITDVLWLFGEKVIPLTIVALAVAVPPSLKVIPALAAVYYRKEFEKGIREFRFPYFRIGRRQEAVLLNRLQALQSGTWFYRSFDERAPLELIEKIWQTRRISSDEIATYQEWLSDPKLTTAFAGNGFSGFLQTPEVASLRTGWVRIDELLRINPATQKPQLIVVVRFNENRPPYRWWAANSSWLQGREPAEASTAQHF